MGKDRYKDTGQAYVTSHLTVGGQIDARVDSLLDTHSSMGSVLLSLNSNLLRIAFLLLSAIPHRVSVVSTTDWDRSN